MMRPVLLLLLSVFSILWKEATFAALENACGKPMTRNGRIIGGEDAQKGEFPFMVSLLGPEEPQDVQVLHKCGAVLLNRRWILTAAHCVYEYRKKKHMSRIVARLGQHAIDGDVQSSRQDLGVDSMVSHPRYGEPHRMSNDIALLKLNGDALFDEHVWPVCLPHPSTDLTGRNATVAGWGRTGVRADGAKTLQKVMIPVLSNVDCKQMYVEAGHNYPLEDNQMCAGLREGGKDSCQGDSGGPLFVKQNGQFVVIGLVSTGIQCGSPLLPGIYTKVISHLSWITEQIKR